MLRSDRPLAGLHCPARLLATIGAILARDSKVEAFRRCCLLRVSLFVATVSMTVVSLHALAPEKLISQFTHTAWSAQDGIPVPVRAIAQTLDGYLWLGTEAGLYRFDGLHFLPWQPASGEHLLSDSVLSLHVARDGSLWIGYGSGGIGVLAGNRLQNFVAGHGVPDGEILSITEDRDGSIWACGPYGFSKYANGVWHLVGQEMGYPAPAGQSLLVDRKGNLWVATDQKDFGLSSNPVRRNTILRLAPGATRFAATGLGVGMVAGISEAPDGAVWIADTNGRAARRITGPAHGLAEIPVEDQPSCLVFDSEHSVWIGTFSNVQRLTTDFAGPREASQGEARQREAPRDRIRRVDGLSGGLVYSTFRDREGNVWFGTSGGLDKFSENKVVSFSAKEGLEPDQQTAVSSTADGSVWVVGYSRDRVWRLREKRFWTSEIRAPERSGVGDILSIFAEGKSDVWLGGNSQLAMGRDGKFSRLPVPSVAKGAYIEAIAKNKAGSLWVALRSKQGGEHIMRFQDGLWDDLSKKEELPKGRCRVMYGDQVGRMWLGFETGEVAVFEGGAFRLYYTRDGLPAEVVLVITADSKGHIWIGGYGGLSRFENGHFSTITKQNGLPGNSVSGFVEDQDGSYWIAGALAIFKVTGEELEKALASPSYRMQGESLDSGDGLRGPPRQREPFPTATRAVDGWLWFATTEGIAGINPHEIPRNLVPPPVIIERMRSDDQDLVVSSDMQLHPNTRNLEFHFTALSFTDPAQVQFRYKLDGYDEVWRGPVSIREVRYTNLPPGSYTFRVLACNNDGVWNEEGARLEFSISPAYYQTSWFRVLCIAAALWLLWAIYQIRLRVLHQRQLLLERNQELLQRHHGEITALNERLVTAQEEERSRIAGELHDGVLQQLTVLSLLLGTAKRLGLSEPDLKKQITEVQKKLIEVGTDIRQLSHGLHPPVLQESGLPGALTAYCEEFHKAHDILVSCDVDASIRELSVPAALCLYRIAQEALGNVAKHSRATEVEVRLTRADGRVCLWVKDDGAGFVPNQAGESGGLGLINMRERVRPLSGTLELESEPGRGTTVRAEVPTHDPS
jgi:signal transduction histidine kinase/ligand-binding sensor domain-containing protein